VTFDGETCDGRGMKECKILCFMRRFTLYTQPKRHPLLKTL
jgi:hypothetical protein